MTAQHGASEAALTCGGCGGRIDCCELCDRNDCAAATCFTCVRTEAGLLLPEPHQHGG